MSPFFPAPPTDHPTTSLRHVDSLAPIDVFTQYFSTLLGAIRITAPTPFRHLPARTSQPSLVRSFSLFSAHTRPLTRRASIHYHNLSAIYQTLASSPRWSSHPMLTLEYGNCVIGSATTHLFLSFIAFLYVLLCTYKDSSVIRLNSMLQCYSVLLEL